MTATAKLNALDILKRMAAATGSPKYGGIDPEHVTELGFDLPGGGMSCYATKNNVVIIEVRCWPGIVRASCEIDVNNPVDFEYHHHPALPPRRRDIARLRMWWDIANGMDPTEAVERQGLGNNIGHAHAGFPQEPGDVGPQEALEIAIRNGIPFELHQLLDAVDFSRLPAEVIKHLKSYLDDAIPTGDYLLDDDDAYELVMALARAARHS